MEFHLKSISLHLSDFWPCQYSFLVVCLLVSYWVPLSTWWSYHYWSANLKIQQMLTITGQLQLPQLSPRYLSRSCCHDSQVPVDCRQSIWFQASTWDRYGHIFTQQTVIFTVIRTHLYTSTFLMQKKAFDRVNHWTLAKKLLDRNVPLHIVYLLTQRARVSGTIW